MSTKRANRTEAATELMSLYNSLEVRPLKFKTIYNRIFWRNGAWHLIGYAHDYTY